MTINSEAADVFRDYEVADLPASGDHDPAKSEIRGLFGTVSSAIELAQLAVFAAEAEVYDTKALMDDDTSQADGVRGFVRDDPDASLNGLYIWDDSPGEWDAVYLNRPAATNDQARAGTSTTTLMTPAATAHARIYIPPRQVIDGSTYYGENLLWGVLGTAYTYRGVSYRNAPLWIGKDGLVRAALSPASFLSAEAASFVDTQIVIDFGAKGQVYNARKVASVTYTYLSTQDGQTLPYRVWSADPGSAPAQLKATDLSIDGIICYGQSWQTADMIDTVAPFPDEGEEFNAYTFLNAFDDPLQFVGVLTQVPLITGFTPLKPGVGVAVGSVAAQTLSRLRRDLNKHMRSVLTFSAAYPGYAWAALRPGSEPWNTLLGYIEAAEDLAGPKYGMPIRWRGVSIIEGAAASAVDTVDCYAALTTMCDDFDDLTLNSAWDLTASEKLLDFFIDVTPPVSEATTPYPQTWDQIEFARDNTNGRTWMIGPRYAFPYQDNIHYTRRGYAQLGELHGLAMQKVLADRDAGVEPSWVPLWVTFTGANPNITVSGTSIVITVSQPYLATGNLVRDTTTIEQAVKDGFVVKVGGSSRTITSVSLGANSITLNMAASIAAAAVAEVSYCAYGAGSTSGVHSGVWGNIKKVGPASRWFEGETIDHWLMPFKHEVTAT